MHAHTVDGNHLLLQTPPQPAGAPPRVFMLAFREQSERNVLFWMQEPSTAQDEQLRSAVDAAVNTPMGACGIMRYRVVSFVSARLPARPRL